MSTSELAAYLRVTRIWFYRHPDIPCKRVGKRRDRLFDKNEVIEYLKKKYG